MTELCAERGYPSVSIAQVSSRARVSSATFYEQFTGKEDCLIAAYRTARDRVFRQMEPIRNEGGWQNAARATLEVLFEALQADPSTGRFFFVEALAGGAEMRKERECAIKEHERRVRRFFDSPATGSETLDIPAAALEGAGRYVISRLLHAHSEDRLQSLTDDWITWMASYARPFGTPTWSTSPEALLAGVPGEKPAATGSPLLSGRLPRGRHGLAPSVVTRSQRTRIIGGTAEVMMAKGYASATVADIVAAAGVSRDVFYEHFTDKQSAFLEAEQFATQEILEACATAYFRATDWPARVWNALGVLLGLIAEHPAIAHLRFVECYSAGATAIRISEELIRTAVVFLEDGFNYRSESSGTPRLALQLITGAVLEVIYREVARGKASELPRYLPQLTYVALAPFTGVDDAIESVTRAASARVRAAG